MPAFADRVKETSTTTGTGTLTLGGAATGFQTFSTAFGNGVSVYYVISGGSEWEVGIGTTGAGTLSRDTVLKSSNANALVSLSAGTKDVFCSYVADRAVTTSDTATLTNKTISGSSNTLSNIANAALTNSSVTVNGTSIALGASGTVTAAAGTLTGTTLASNVVSSSLTSLGTIATGVWQGTAISDTYLATISTAGKVSNSATTATANNTASAIVARDASGNFTAGTVTATLSGAAPAGSLSGSTLASGVTASSLTSVGTLTGLTVSGSGTVNLQDGTLQRPIIKDYGETYTTPSISSGTLTLDLTNGNVFRVSRNANITTLTISNPSPTSNACSFTLIFDANGTSYTITWPAAVKWPGGTAPTITTTASRSDMFVFYTNNAGTTWYAMTAAQNFVTT